MIDDAIGILASKTPIPNSDAVIAMKSPAMAPPTTGNARALPTFMLQEIAKSAIGPGVANKTRQTATNVSHVSTAISCVPKSVSGRSLKLPQDSLAPFALLALATNQWWALACEMYY
tara:strand:+ start:853 stop:1203 length:351 start_codon:yes stop_codon:yes gene_type:complete